MSRVRSVSNQRAVTDAIREASRLHVRARANELKQVTLDTHRTAPRGGDNLNRFGERRSAPGSPPAMETGTLFALIDQSVVVTATTQVVQAEVMVNYRVLEDGTRRIRPRPLGRIALERFTGSVR